MFKDVLLVEPDSALRVRIRGSLRAVAHVDGCADFSTARGHLFAKPYDWLVTNLRLDTYNGLHLVHLASTSQLPVRSVVYGERRDVSLAREAQIAGAFYESRDRLHRALPAYLRGEVPTGDRRDPGLPDRRGMYRGGRRAYDSQLIGPAPAWA